MAELTGSRYLKGTSGFLGGFMAADGIMSAGRDKAASLRSTASQLRDQANEVTMASQLKSAEAKRQMDLAKSRALAVAAAQGGAADPDVINVVAGLDVEGKLASLTSIYEGAAKARTLKKEAFYKGIEAKQTENATKMDAFGSILSAATSFGSMFL